MFSRGSFLNEEDYQAYLKQQEKQYVYLLWYERFDSRRLIGMFSSEEAAKKRKKSYTYLDQIAMSIEKEVVE